MPNISPMAVVDPKASLASDVEVGPFCVIGPDVTIDSGCRLINNVTLMGHTTLGKDNLLFPNVVIGGPPQDKKYRNSPTRVEIGNGNIFREAVTIHLGTEKGTGVTRVGNNNLLMVNAHIGHDAFLGNNCILVNNVMFAGHVICHDNTIINGAVGVNQFVTIGELSWIGGFSRIHFDVPPFCKVDGADMVRSINAIGLRRAGYAEEEIVALEDAHRRLFHRDKPLARAMAEFDVQNGLSPAVKRLIEFLQRRGSSSKGRYQETLRAK